MTAQHPLPMYIGMATGGRRGAYVPGSTLMTINSMNKKVMDEVMSRKKIAENWQQLNFEEIVRKLDE